MSDPASQLKSVDDCIAEILCPCIDTKTTLEDSLEKLRENPCGCVFLSDRPGDETRELITELQQTWHLPLAVCADVEKSAKRFVAESADFPTPMAMGAANDPLLIEAMALSCARESRAIGINWTLAPVVDLNMNFMNGPTNTRSLGDKADKVSQLVVPWIKTLQSNGLAATAKHFPGDGVDDRDQHLCTSVNSLPMEQWIETYGQVWRAAIDAGVMSIMPGHISLPAWQGFKSSVAECLPATLDARVLNDLLRKELGFNGVIISDAAVMVGLSSCAPEAEQVVRFIEAGGDVYLFANPITDRQRLKKAVESGRLTEERLYASAQRIVRMKERLGLFDNLFGPEPSQSERQTFEMAAEASARKSITILRRDQNLPLKKKHIKKALTVTLRYENERQPPRDLEAFDSALSKRGIEVKHLFNPSHYEIKKEAPGYDAVFMNYYITPHMKLGTNRLIEHIPFTFWRSFTSDHDCVCHSSFGTPYVTYDLPFLPNLVCAYSPSEYSQQAVVDVWFGEEEATGVCPVEIPEVRVEAFRPYR